MAHLLQSRAPAMSFSTSFTSSGLQSRPFTTFPIRPRCRILTVQTKIREIFMPALSSTMTEDKIVSWIKSEGDILSKGESVVVVESEKADMDVEEMDFVGFRQIILVLHMYVFPSIQGNPFRFLLCSSKDKEYGMKKFKRQSAYLKDGRESSRMDWKKAEAVAKNLRWGRI
ncbi:hypothetical protein RHGRI_001264 [Rhododendron griersonianum]|uniref:Lipoyl-binding domain-containing protein n=1 Tax=Rhododendron griersonianum TaxID=479676 RepID=A0AAV6LKG3_9ERIC|nr:hypothetical protein RHGRI_001264 [Rhododendron griersonianum]